jgi:hypothetical protein
MLTSVPTSRARRKEDARQRKDGIAELVHSSLKNVKPEHMPIGRRRRCDVQRHAHQEQHCGDHVFGTQVKERTSGGSFVGLHE